MKKQLRTLLVLILCLAPASPVFSAQLMGKPTGHYLPGPNAVEGAMNPPPGSDNLAIATVSYSFDLARDKSGRRADSPDVKALVSTLRWIHMFEEGLFGGSTGFNIALTGAHMDASSIPGPPGAVTRQSFTRAGDPSVEFMQGWVFERFAIRTRLGMFLGIGDYHKNDAVNYAKDFWSFHAQLGGTAWLDETRRFALTAMGTYETSTYMKNWAVRPGDTLTLEGGMAVNATENFSLALSGFMIRQMTNDRGRERGYANLDGKHQVYGLGPYARIMLPFIKPGAHFTLTWWHEFEAENRSEGEMVFTELVIPF
ncbi:MAG: transporter [Deltaproteobacteria bacterium]|jgi:hypothetical protein|nr:transporter [Deltaproteobacteria bacterium]